jgi:son of sevenless-like protein
MTVSHNAAPPPSILPPNRKVLRISDLDVLEVARQLTLIETTTFNRIPVAECLHKSWSSPDPAHGPNIRQGIRLSNQISRWVQVSVLAESQPKTRASVIKFFIQVAEVRLCLCS